MTTLWRPIYCACEIKVLGGEEFEMSKTCAEHEGMAAVDIVAAVRVRAAAEVIEVSDGEEV